MVNTNFPDRKLIWTGEFKSILLFYFLFSLKDSQLSNVKNRFSVNMQEVVYFTEMGHA